MVDGALVEIGGTLDGSPVGLLVDGSPVGLFVGVSVGIDEGSLSVGIAVVGTPVGTSEG